MSSDDRYQHGEPIDDRSDERSGTEGAGEPADVNRRRFLRTAAAAGAVSAAGFAGLSGTAAAESGEPRERDLSAVDVERELDARAGSLLADLADDGVLADGSASELATEAADLESAFGGAEGAVRFEYGGREVLTSVTHTDDGRLTVRVEPGRDLAYAVLEPAGDDPVVFKRGGAGTAVSCPGCNCSQLLCADGERALICEVEYGGDCILLSRCGC